MSYTFLYLLLLWTVTLIFTLYREFLKMAEANMQRQLSETCNFALCDSDGSEKSVKYCEGCRQCLCEMCVNLHHKLKGFHKHSVVPLEDAQVGRSKAEKYGNEIGVRRNKRFLGLAKKVSEQLEVVEKLQLKLNESGIGDAEHKERENRD